MAQPAQFPLLDLATKEEDGVPMPTLCAECAKHYESESSAVRAKAEGTNLALRFFPGWPQAGKPQTSHKVNRKRIKKTLACADEKSVRIYSLNNNNDVIFKAISHRLIHAGRSDGAEDEMEPALPEGSFSVEPTGFPAQCKQPRAPLNLSWKKQDQETGRQDHAESPPHGLRRDIR